MKYLKNPYVLVLSLALAALPIARVSAVDPGSVPGFSLNFTLWETNGIPDPGQEATAATTLTVVPGQDGFPANAWLESGALVLLEPGTPLSESNNVAMWSDVVVWSGGNTAALYSDPYPFFNYVQNPLGQGTIVMVEQVLGDGTEGVIYRANDGNNNITTWTIVSEVPEPASLALLGTGLAVWAGSRALRRKNS